MIDAGLIQSLLARSSGSTSQRTHQVVWPATGEAAFALPMADTHAVSAAVQTARRAQPTWAERPVSQRAAIMTRFRELVLQRREQGMDLVVAESGKARKDALEEILDIALVASYYARIASRALRDQRHLGLIPGAIGVRERHLPIGVVGVIAPWNYPLTLAATDAIPALVAGNAVILKPDVQTSLCALWVYALLVEAGLPESVMRVVLGDGTTVGSAVIDQVDYVMFTGSTATCRTVAQQCASRLIGCSLELGGKNAMIIRADADPAASAEIAVRACFANAGQLCVSIERIYVHQSIAEAFIGAFVHRTRQLRVGVEAGWLTDMGSLISARHQGVVLDHIADAVSKGARLLTGGTARPDLGPYVVEPTILTGVDHSMHCFTDETFGPVVWVQPYSGDETAIQRANDGHYGLNASILTKDISVARAMATKIRAGTVNINEGYAATWASTATPMGGMGISGLGRRHGVAGLMKYTQSQSIATARVRSLRAPDGFDGQRWGEVLVKAVSLRGRLGLK